MESEIGEERGRLERGVIGVVVGVLGEWEECSLSGLAVVAVQSKILFQSLFGSFGLSIGLASRATL